jgi:ferredoxin
MRLKVDRDLCSGHGRCARYAPALFPLDDAGFNLLRGMEVEVDTADEANARNAWRACPERAIAVVAE